MKNYIILFSLFLVNINFYASQNSGSDLTTQVAGGGAAAQAGRIPYELARLDREELCARQSIEREEAFEQLCIIARTGFGKTIVNLEALKNKLTTPDDWDLIQDDEHSATPEEIMRAVRKKEWLNKLSSFALGVEAGASLVILAKTFSCSIQ